MSAGFFGSYFRRKSDAPGDEQDRDLGPEDGVVFDAPPSPAAPPEASASEPSGDGAGGWDSLFKQEEPEATPEAVAPEAVAPEAVAPEAVAPEAVAPEVESSEMTMPGQPAAPAEPAAGADASPAGQSGTRLDWLVDFMGDADQDPPGRADQEPSAPEAQTPAEAPEVVEPVEPPSVPSTEASALSFEVNAVQLEPTVAIDAAVEEEGVAEEDEALGEDAPSETEDAPSETEGTPAAPALEEPEAAGAAPYYVEEDVAVQALLGAQLATQEQVEAALAEQPGDGLWRHLAESTDREAAYAAVADALGYARADIGEKPTAEFVEMVLSLFAPEVADELLALELLPLAFAMDPEVRQQTLVLVTYDPSRPEVARLMSQMGMRVDLRYGAEADVRARLHAVRPDPSPGPEDDPYAAFADELPSDESPAGEAAGEEPATVEEPAAGEPAFNLSDWAQGPQAPEAEATPPEPTTLEAPEVAAPAPAPTTPEAAPEITEPEGEEEPEEQEAPFKTRDRVVSMLLHKEVITASQARTAQGRQQKENLKDALWRILAEVGGVDREAIFEEAASVYAFPKALLGKGKPEIEFVRSVMSTFEDGLRAKLLRLGVVPFECDLDPQTGSIRLVFISHDPMRPEVHRLMQDLKLERFELQYAPEYVIQKTIVEAFPRKNEFLERMNEDGTAFDYGTNYEDNEDLIDEEQLEAEISRSKLINLFEATLVESVRRGASDIHIYPNARKQIEIHFRVDGRLMNWHTEEKVHPEALLAVIKDNSMNVDRFERDAAQDGFIQRWIDDALIRFRVSVLPIANASQELRSESIVIRVIDDRKVITDLTKLGLLESALERFNQAIRQPHGMVILTGPTGSGKSTTLVAALHQVVTPEVNVLTVEDPVEYIIPGVRQIKLNNKLDLDGALRAILRHDPDVVMVGEMRDRKTAELAIKLANTGHLTFSTLHTNDAPAAVSRLYKMGIEPFLIAYAINLVVAQRLIRALCPDCKVKDDDPDPVMLRKLGFTDQQVRSANIFAQGHDADCPTCKGVGYKGRRAICEALYFSRAIRHMIVEADGAIDEGAIRELACKEGMLTLRDTARHVVLLGETSVMEMIRVTTTEE